MLRVSVKLHKGFTAIPRRPGNKAARVYSHVSPGDTCYVVSYVCFSVTRVCMCVCVCSVRLRRAASRERRLARRVGSRAAQEGEVNGYNEPKRDEKVRVSE